MVEETLSRWFSQDFLSQRSDRLDYARSRLGAAETTMLSQTWRAISQHDAGEALERLRVPVTCVAGIDDVSSPPDAVRDVARRVPHGRYVEVPGGHLLPLENPHDVSRVIREHRARSSD